MLAALPVAFLTLLPLAVVVGAALSPQPGIWQHLSQQVLPTVLANTAVLLVLVAAGVLLLGVSLYPYVYLLARNAFISQGRHALEAAQSLGHGPWRAFYSVTLPMARPWIAAGLALALMETLADFGAVAVFNHDTFTTAIYKAWFDLHSFGTAAQLAALLALAVLCAQATEQRAWRGQRFATAGPLLQRRPLRRPWRWAAAAWCGAVLLAGFLGPVAQLLAWSLEVWRDDLDQRWWGFVWNTLQLGLTAAAVATALALWLALVRRRHADAATGITVRLALMGYAFPGVVLAVGLFVPVAWVDNLLLAWLGPARLQEQAWLKGSLLAMLLALVARFLAVAYQATDSALQRIGRQHEEACASLGLGRWQTLQRLHLPLLRGGLLTTVLMVMIDVMKEMPITLMMRSHGWDTLAVRVFQLTSESLWNHAALPALAIVLIGLVPVALLVQGSEARATP